MSTGDRIALDQGPQANDYEILLTDGTEILLRQIHPNFVRDGRPSSQAFRPTAKDENQLSVAREALTSAEQAFAHYTDNLKLKSCGTWGVSVAECHTQSLRTFGQPLSCPPSVVADPAHAIIDFRDHSKSKIEAKGSLLARAALARGRLYPRDPTTEDEGSE